MVREFHDDVACFKTSINGLALNTLVDRQWLLAVACSLFKDRMVQKVVSVEAYWGYHSNLLLPGLRGGGAI